jgi:NAD(P)-dependent dehydrogenase (short-subunit alcohol dehydrogenase family)
MSKVIIQSVSPGIIKTPMHSPEAHGFLATLHPAGRMGAIEEIVEAVLYLETAGSCLVRRRTSTAALTPVDGRRGP